MRESNRSYTVYSDPYRIRGYLLTEVMVPIIPIRKSKIVCLRLIGKICGHRVRKIKCVCLNLIGDMWASWYEKGEKSSEGTVDVRRDEVDGVGHLGDLASVVA